MKSYLILLLPFFLWACSEEKKEEKAFKKVLNPDYYNAAFLIVDGVYNTELTAPYDVLEHTKYRKRIRGINVFTVSDKSTAVTTSEGLRILPDYNFLKDELPNIDILIVPSAEASMDEDLKNQALLDFIRKVDQEAIYVTSHCDGAFLLAKSGVLNSRVSTTFPGSLEAYKKMFPELKVNDSVLFVHDGKYITSAGGAKSFEASLYLMQLMYGKKVADEIAEGMVIDWKLEEVPHQIVTEAL
ncbi:MAG: glutamine amidotransferase [Bacteroidetes bacterium]|nr:MAG: glutamine amidotransferase [Bacteroidota bacterium]